MALDAEGKSVCAAEEHLPEVKKKALDFAGSHMKLFLLYDGPDIDGGDEKKESSTSTSYKIVCKIADLGTACWTYKHFTSDVQTRQYRAPEVLVGYEYDTAIDVWSVACIAFELLTGGDYLFNPAGKEGRYTRDEDHLAYMMELMGPAPEIIYALGKYSYEMFNDRGALKNIKNLKRWGLTDVLLDKYAFEQDEAEAIANFLSPMLNLDPEKRATASECLKHSWLADVEVDDAHFSVDIEQNVEEEIDEGDYVPDLGTVSEHSEKGKRDRVTSVIPKTMEKTLAPFKGVSTYDSDEDDDDVDG